jgi:hypothetical protein
MYKRKLVEKPSNAYVHIIILYYKVEKVNRKWEICGLAQRKKAVKSRKNREHL